MGESKARDPMVVEPRRWHALGATVYQSLGEGRAAQDAAGRDRSVRPVR